MSALYLLVGLPGSGKTTQARRMLAQAPLGSLVRVNRDDLRRMMLPTGYRRPVGAAEVRVTAAAHQMITVLLGVGCDVVCDDTNLRSEHRERLAALAAGVGARVVVLDLTGVPVEVCVRRDAARSVGERVGEDVIRRMAAQHLVGGIGGNTHRVGGDTHREHHNNGGHHGSPY